MTWYFSHPEAHLPMTTSRIDSPGAGGARVAALAALARHDASKATPALREPGAARHSPPIPYDQLLVRGPWPGTCLA